MLDLVVSSAGRPLKLPPKLLESLVIKQKTQRVILKLKYGSYLLWTVTGCDMQTLELNEAQKAPFSLIEHLQSSCSCHLWLTATHEAGKVWPESWESTPLKR